MRRALLAPVLLALVLPAGGCFRHWVDFEVERIDSLRVERIDDDGFDVIVRSHIENPNRAGATLRDIHFRVATGAHHLAHDFIAGPVTVDARSHFTLETALTIRYADLPADLPRRVADRRLPLTVHTALDATTSVGTYHMDLAWTGETDIADTIEVAVAGRLGGRALAVRAIALERLGLGGFALRVRVALHNAFAFPIGVRGGRLDLDIADQRFGRARIDQPFTIPPGQRVERDVRVTAAYDHAWHSLLALVRSGPTFRARGTLHIDPVAGVTEVPFDITADASVLELD